MRMGVTFEKKSFHCKEKDSRRGGPVKRSLGTEAEDGLDSRIPILH